MKDEAKTKEQLINELIEMRNRTEKALRESEEQYKNLFENIPIGMYRTTPDGRILMANPALIRMLGYFSFDELASHNLEEEGFELIYPRDQFKKLLERHGEVRGLESEWIRRDGTVIFVHENARAIRGENGTVLYYEGTVEDITESRMLYEKSQKQAEELRALYEDLNKRNKDLEILNTITQAVHQSLDLEEVYNIALDMTIALENVDMAFIYLVDRDRKEAILQAYRNIPEDYINRAGRIPYPKGLTWKVINAGEIVNIEDIQKDPYVGPAGRNLGHHGVLGIPITLEGKVIGVIYFASYKERQFNKQEIDLLSSIGNQIAVAIAKAKLHRELSKKTQYEKIIGTVTQAVHQSINLQDVLENAVETMSKNIDGADSVAIYLVEGEEAVLKANRGFTHQYIDRAGRISYPKGVTWKTIIEEKPRYCADVDEDTVIGPAGREMGIKSYLCMPINYEGKTVGALNITSFEKNAFDEEELKLLEIIARQIEVAFNNAKQVETLRQSEEEQKSSRERLRALAARLQLVREEERTLIAREVHDELGQALTGLKMDLSWLASRLPENQKSLQGKAKSMLKLVDNSIQTVREISTELRPGVLDDFGLTAAIEWQAQEFQTKTGIRYKFTSSPENIILDKGWSTAIFRIFQEALTNVARHANATKVNISLKEEDDNLILEVKDNGKGITEDEISNPKSLGLLGMRERALLSGGEINISGTPGKGTTITVRIPFKRQTP